MSLGNISEKHIALVRNSVVQMIIMQFGTYICIFRYHRVYRDGHMTQFRLVNNKLSLSRGTALNGLIDIRFGRIGETV